MQNVKFFDKNRMEIKVGDFVVIDGVKCEVSHFVLRSDHGDPIVHFKGKVTGSLLREITKHTPKLTKVKRTFEEVCELRDNGAMFKMIGSEAEDYKPNIAKKEDKIFVRDFCLSMWKFKPKNSDNWQELEYKEVEE